MLVRRCAHVIGGNTHASAVHGPDFKTRRIQLANLLFEFLMIAERVVADDDLAREVKRDFAADEQGFWSRFVVEPMEDGFEWVKPAVKCQHDIRRRLVHS